MNYFLSDYELQTGIELCFSKAERLADDAALIIKNNGTSSHTLVLYEFAIEEYGKGKLLRECKSKRNTRKGDYYDVDKSIFKSHQKTSKKALESLPEDCKKIDLEVHITRGNDRTVTIKRSGKTGSNNSKNRSDNDGIISIGPMVTGHFTTVGLDIEKDEMNLERHIRWPALYVDWDDQNRTWRHEFFPDIDRLSNAISSFKKQLIKSKIKETS